MREKARRRIKLDLRAFEGFKWPIDQFSAHFETSTKWLPESDSFQNMPRIKKPFVLWHRSTYGVILERRGRRKMVGSEAYQARQLILAKRLKPPMVQDLLRRAYSYKERLANAQDLTQEALAREEGIDPAYLTRILALLNLAPEIQHHILNLKPIVGRGLLTERRLRPIAKIPDHRKQLARFQELLCLPIRTCKDSSILISAPPSQASAHPGA